jgi:hypothetical protein
MISDRCTHATLPESPLPIQVEFAVASLRSMQAVLKFNICKLETSIKKFRISKSAWRAISPPVYPEGAVCILVLDVREASVALVYGYRCMTT